MTDKRSDIGLGIEEGLREALARKRREIALEVRASGMSYRGYSAHIDYDDEGGIFVGHIAGIADVIGFHADTVNDLRTAFFDAVDDYIDTCAKVGKA